MAQIKQYDPITAAIRSKLIGDTRMTVSNIYPVYLSFIENATYPCLTICRDYGMTVKNRTGYQTVYYYIHGWFRPSTTAANAPVSQAAALMNLTIDILDIDKVSDFASIRLIDSVCPLYEKDTRTTYFMTRYKIVVSKNIMYV